MYTLTFYSFKAAGRTLALVNAAAELARRGRRVLVVDFDLEAPALDTAGLLRPPLDTAGRRRPHPGVVGYVTHYVNTGQEPAVGDYLYNAGPVGEKGGRIWVMPAGNRDRDYRHALARLDWLGLYQSHDGFGFLNRLKEQWKKFCDYVLIDCPGGHTLVEGICTRQLPDAVVALFFPDEQNLVGLGPVCRAIRTENQRGRPKPIALHFVMSNIPAIDEEEDEGQELARRRDNFLTRLHIPELAATLHHRDGLVTLDRPPLVLDHPRARLAREYRDLVDALIVHNVEDKEGGLLFFEYMKEAYSRGPVGAEWGEEEKRILNFRCQHGEDAAFRVKVAYPLMAGRRFDEAELTLDKVLELQPALAEARLLRSRCREEQRNTAEAVKDLMAYLALPGLEDKDALPGLENEPILTALRRLYRLAPKEFDDLCSKPEVENLRREDEFLWWLDGNLGAEEDGPQWYRDLEPRDRLRLEVLLRPEQYDPATEEKMTPEQRLRRDRRRLQEQINKLSANPSTDERERNQNAFSLACDHFDLALAEWKATGCWSQDLCREGLEYHDRVDAGFKGNFRTRVLKESPDYRQLVALALWATGRGREAREEIAQAENRVHAATQDERFHSPWRGREEVTRQQFLDDCQAIAREFGGIPDIQPDFLR